MAERERTRGRTQTWPDEPALPWLAAWLPRGLSDWLRAIAARTRDAAAVEFGPGRVMPWLPVAFGLGVVVYFSAEHEPAWPAAAALAAVAAGHVYLARRRAVAFPVALLAAASATGFAFATAKTALIDHPVLERPLYSVGLKGFVEVREERERSDRIVVKVASLDDARARQRPERVRLSVKRGLAPPVGAFISVRARLDPPPAPLRPGGYDFSRDLYFQRIGAVGFVTGAIKVEAPPAPPGRWLRYAAFVDGVRDAIDRRIRQTVSGDAGSIASALLTGKRDAISAPVNDAMNVSGLAHVLSISGYHMAVVAGVVFFTVRAVLALVPGAATRHPIKKWAALAALIAAACYLALSGAEVATQRAFIMTAIVLIGVMADRAALTLRTLAIAALCVLALAPEAVAHPSFQMSFAATLALVAAYERGPFLRFGGRDTPLAARAALWGGGEVAALVFASLVAGLATTPYVAFHFHRATPYGVLANLLAMPIVSAVVMPAGLIGLVAMPFGLDAPLWRLMGVGIDWMDGVALWVASLPGALVRIPAFGVGTLLLASAGLIAICLLRTRLRLAGAALLALAILAAAMTPRPDVYVSAGADTVAVRTASGGLAAARDGGDTFALREWLAADADARAATDAHLKGGFACDADGCVAPLADGALVALSRTPAAVAEDCARAALVVTAREAPPTCATALDRRAARTHGAAALRHERDTWRIETAYPGNYRRPWTGREVEEAAPAAANTRGPARDATPRPEDLDPGD